MESDFEKNLKIQEGRKNYITKLKSRLILVASMFVLSILFIVIGVSFLPKSSRKVELSFLFNSGNISAQLTRQDSGAKVSSNVSPLVFSPEVSPLQLDVDSWSNTVEFNETQNDITITISVFNTANFPIRFKIQNLSNKVDNLKVRISNEEGIAIESLKSGTIIISLSAINKNVELKNSQLEFQIQLDKI